MPTLVTLMSMPSGELDIADVIAAQVGVHDAGNGRIVRGILVELDSLDQRGGAVPHADDCDTYFFCLP